LKFLDPNDANEILLNFKKPKLLVDRKQNFTNSFKAFQESFARHCALLSCVDETRRTEITLRMLEVIFEKISAYYKSLMFDSSAADNSASNVGKELYDKYIASIKVICAHVETDNEDLLSAIGATNFSYRPKQFITGTRNKYKFVLWESSDDYDSRKLYVVVKDICTKHLKNIIQ